VLTSAALGTSAASAAPITFTDVSLDPSKGLSSYRRKASTTNAILDAVKLKPFLSFQELAASPLKARGSPGVALLDYDRDGDLDIYVTNGPGRANSLYQNQLKQTSQMTFVDVATAAGVDATAQDSTGVCFGDIDNDGDEDMLVLGRMEPSRFYANNGNGTFSDISTSANVSRGARGYTSCAMGDIDNDGRLDITVANTLDWSRQDGLYTDFFGFSHPNELYHNDGGNQFSDVSESSGILQLYNVPPGDATISWAVSLIDYDQDGDLDLIHGDDQGGLAPAAFKGVDRGLLQIFANDGTGHFQNLTAVSWIDADTFDHPLASSWMGLSFGDLNCDGSMDMFGSTFGDYGCEQFGVPNPPPFNSSQWFLGSPSGVFTRPGVGALVGTPFGWGTSIFDYDNDADSDITFFGNIDLVPFMLADNPGTILRNENCSATFTYDAEALASSSPSISRQEVEGVATGDLNADGFTDIVYASGQYVPETVPLVHSVFKWGSPFDATAYVLPTFYPIGPFEWEWAGKSVEDGRLGVQINSANNGNKWVQVSVTGAKGLTTNGTVNRDGIGATVRFLPDGGQQSSLPILGGSSYQSQDALTKIFGLGAATKGRVEVFWPGGLRTRLYNVLASERVNIPELPCDPAGTWANVKAYKKCVNTALVELQMKSIITPAFRSRLEDSAVQAYTDFH
jgi:hypothetical protein